MGQATTSRVNADFSTSAGAVYDDTSWQASPMAGVERKLLDRVGGEVARATSIVRYAPESFFSAHRHGGGEEILVLDGTFSDETGDYGPGSYLRNPPGSGHTPFSREGCIILVKLWQMFGDESKTVAISPDARPAPEKQSDGVGRIPLFTDAREIVRLEAWPAANEERIVEAEGGIEVFVVEGSLRHEGTRYGKWSWLRLPPGMPLKAAAPQGCELYVKTGHLTEMPPLPG